MSLAIFPSVTTGITASTSSDLAGGTELNSRHNVIATCANAGDSVRLPGSCGKGAEVFVRNNGAASADVFPPTSTATINGGSAGAAVAVAAAKGAVFVCVSADGETWFSVAGA